MAGSVHIVGSKHFSGSVIVGSQSLLACWGKKSVSVLLPNEYSWLWSVLLSVMLSSELKTAAIAAIVTGLIVIVGVAVVVGAGGG